MAARVQIADRRKSEGGGWSNRETSEKWVWPRGTQRLVTIKCAKYAHGAVGALGTDKNYGCPDDADAGTGFERRSRTCGGDGGWGKGVDR